MSTRTERRSTIEAYYPQPPMIVFDFDGVLFDSFNESFLSAVNTYLTEVPGHTLRFNEPLTLDSVSLLKQDNPAFLDEFSRLMPFGNFAEDYFVILRLLETKSSQTVQDQEAFERFKSTIPEPERNAYQDHFFTSRRDKQVTDPNAWAAQLSPFPGILKIISSLSRRCELAIATSKDRASVTLLLDKYGLTTYFKNEAILDKDFGPTKLTHLRHLQQAFSIPFEYIHFIDDKVQHLLSVRELGLNAYLALWGYNTPRQHALARQEGFELLQLEDLIRLGRRSDEQNPS